MSAKIKFLINDRIGTQTEEPGNLTIHYYPNLTILTIYLTPD